MKVYMDNGATTRVTEPVMAAMQPYFCQIFGNPSSVHGFGREARKAVEAARNALAMNLTAEQAAQITGLPLDQVLELQKELTPAQ